MASTDSQRPIPTPLDVISTWQAGGPPREMRVTFMLMPVGYTPCLSVQVSGFDDIGRLTQTRRLLSASCSSGQHFACGFLQIPPYDGHPCRSANRSPCRVGRGLSPPSRLPRHHSGANSASHGATRHAWRTNEKPAGAGSSKQSPGQGGSHFRTKKISAIRSAKWQTL